MAAGMTRSSGFALSTDAQGSDRAEKSLMPPSQHIEKAMSRSASPAGSDSSVLSMAKPEIPKWRKLEMERLKMRPVLPKLDIEAPPKDVDMGAPAVFLDPSELQTPDVQDSTGSDVSAEDSRPSQDSATRDYEPETQDLADFYDHSLTIHEAIPSSQLELQQSITPGTPIYESSEEMFPDQSTTPGGIIRTSSQRRLSQAPKPKVLTNLCDIQGASYLEMLLPQTKTVNLVCGVLSVSPSRIVTVGANGRRPKKIEMVELMVGDDTKSGFSITIWLPREMHVNWKDGAQEKPEGARSILRRSLKAIQVRDVVLIQNVALSTFRGKVHGQSLRGDVTKVDTLFRKKVGDEEQAGCYTAQNLKMATAKDQQILKVKRVRDWLAESMGEPSGEAAGSGKKKGKRSRFMINDMP